MSPRNPSECAHDRKTRERLEFLSLPPAEAQRRISLNLRAPLRDLTAPGQELRSSLLPAPSDDEMVDE